MNPEPNRPAEESSAEDARAWISALADGDAQAAEQACRLWREDEESRRAWHAYHLIGDVMRSDELARPPGQDAAFMAAIRQRLAAEPVVLAPAAPTPRRRPWLVPGAAIAGLAMLSGVLVLARIGVPGSSAPAVEIAAAPQARGQASAAGPVATPQLLASQGLITDPRLDELLRAHQSAGAGLATAAPGGSLHRVDLPMPAVAER